MQKRSHHKSQRFDTIGTGYIFNAFIVFLVSILVILCPIAKVT